MGAKTHSLNHESMGHLNVSCFLPVAQAQASGPHAQAQKDRPLAHLNKHKNTKTGVGAKIHESMRTEEYRFNEMNLDENQ